MTMLYHLLTDEEYRAARAHIVAGSLHTDGFIHCCPDETTMLAVANTFYQAVDEPLVVVRLDTARLTAPVRWQAPVPAAPAGIPATTLFPHVYGPLERTAVIEVRYPRRDPTGRFVALDLRGVLAGKLDLLPHPEGGWYRRTWTAPVRVHPPGYPAERATATAIYYLLQPGEASRRHRVRSDELWSWHCGSPLTLTIDGTSVVLGPDVEVGECPHLVVPGGAWQATAPAGPNDTLVTCVVSPGFDAADFVADPAC